MNNQTNNMICESAYLYSTFPGKLTVRKGSVVASRRTDGLARFYNEDDVESKKFILCASNPVAIYNSLVWLPERDDQKAANILVKYHEKQIEELKKKIEGHLNKIKMIRGGIKNGNL